MLADDEDIVGINMGLLWCGKSVTPVGDPSRSSAASCVRVVGMGEEGMSPIKSGENNRVLVLPSFPMVTILNSSTSMLLSFDGFGQSII